LQVPTVLTRLPLQVGGRQTVSAAYFAQPPIPSQLPVCPQVALAVVAQTLCGSGAPSAVGSQVPRRPLWLQLTQGPLQVLLQQMLSAQKPEAHCPAPVQAPPIGRRPQLPATHLVLAAQSASEAQVVKQLFVVVSQLNGAQISDGPEVQSPVPSQTRVPLTATPSQVPGWQTVPIE
jgi:hypothetical protein